MWKYEVLCRDKELSDLVEKHGEIEIPVADDAFQRLVVSVVNQQLSSSSAEAIKQRLFDGFMVTPEGILEADDEQLRDTGLSRQKVRYLNEISREFRQKGYSASYFDGVTDDEVTKELTSIHGVGDWTAKMFLIFVLGRKDVFPVEDLGIRNAMKEIYSYRKKTEMRRHAESWKPYRSYATLHLWRTID